LRALVASATGEPAAAGVGLAAAVEAVPTSTPPMSKAALIAAVGRLMGALLSDGGYLAVARYVYISNQEAVVKNFLVWERSDS
jgi:H+/gluconate symporter-like permease